jgi:glycosyltransferase involved in cell wall biosynthesis
VRVLFVVHRYPPEFAAGTELHTARLAEELATRLHDVFVFTGSPRSPLVPRRVRDVQDGLVTVRFVEAPQSVDFAMGSPNPWVREQFERALAEFQPDVVHVQHLLHLSSDLIEVARARGIPTLVTLHDFWFLCPLVHPSPRTIHPRGASVFRGLCCFAHYERKRWRAPLLAYPPRLARMGAAHLRRPRFMQQQLEIADLLVAPSEFVRERFEAFGVPPERLAVVPHPIASADGAAREIGDPVRFGFVGNIAPAKGVQLLCEAFSRVPGDSVLRLFGSTPDAGYFRRLRRYLGPRITYEGAFDQSSVGDVYGAVDVLVVPSLVDESFSLVAWEAQAHGRPVIGAASGALSEVIDHDRNGLLVPPGDVSALAGAIARCHDRAEVERMAAAAKTPAGPSDYSARIEEIYRLVTARAARATSTR